LKTALFTFLLLSIYSCLLPAQTPTIQDCLGAIPICQPVYSESQSPTGTGNYPNEINSSISCTDAEIQTIWYTFTTAEDGNFGFLITPNNIDDDYDWALFNITNASCADIYNDPDLLVSCNAAGGGVCDGLTGANGNTTYDIQGAGCNFDPPSLLFGLTPFNDLVPVLAGNTYVLMVSNWSGSPFGYTIDFGISDVDIFDTENPDIYEIDFPVSCSGDEIEMIFSENLQCSTISDANFSLDGPGGPYSVALSSAVCDAGGDYDKFFTLIVDPPVTETGSYTLTILPNGSDPMLDNCANPYLAADFSFFADPVIVPELNFGPDTVLCPGESLLLDATSESADYSWQDGSTDSTYLVTQAGTYSVTVSNACGLDTEWIDVILLDGPPEVELGEDLNLCDGETQVLDVGSPQATYSWQDGSETPNFLVDAPGLYAVSVTNACGMDSDSLLVAYFPALVVDLPESLFPCRDNAPVTLDVTNPDATYLWQDGYEEGIYMVESNGLYIVTVTNSCEEITDSVEITFIEPVALSLGADTAICPGDTLWLDASIPGSTYLWQDSSTAAVFPVVNEGTYSVLITNDCEALSDEVEIQQIPNIEIELGEDQYFCSDSLILDASSHEFVTYEWQNGLPFDYYKVTRPGFYRVEAQSPCELVTDSITLWPCEKCLIYIPNAISPNDDGINDNFQVFADCLLEDFHLQVFDRWGNRVYFSENQRDLWDGRFNGKYVNDGVYVWILTYRYSENGSSFEKADQGSLTIIR
jgi:gliding motility-associated-like protein